ncbi:hypothetical protein VP01_1364g4 [Puccinia sorghi]|uniref:Uncharacterized protein n=1 Tax=Puccinia sorghi TaxID=27349 RepID=A0A0L6VNM4_9BASI|nr:hypothetical protein VP01_1364g4 [Puccinia sorghi]
MDPNQSQYNNATQITVGSNDLNNFEQLQHSLAQKDNLIEQLLDKVTTLELAVTSCLAKSTSKEAKFCGSKSRNKNLVGTSQKEKPSPTPRKSSKTIQKLPKTKSPAQPQKPPEQKTPVSQRARSATPQTPGSNGKKNPLQMLTKDQPAGFERTKEEFYIHIQLMWGLTGQRATPTPPDPNLLREFNQRFSDPNQIEQKSKPFEMQNKVELRLVRGCSIYLNSFLIWAPDLDSQMDSLYNEACRMSAIVTFRQAVANKVYAYMSIKPTYIKDLALLQLTYNHYVHYHMAQIYAKEKKHEGKHIQDEEKKVIQQARQRRYLRVLECIQAHSNNEFLPKKNVHVVKRLPFCSESATAFIRRLDEVICNGQG